MHSKTILFFDDYPLASENKLFLMLLRRRVETLGVHIIPEKAIRRLEDQLQSLTLTVLILDIISEVPRDFTGIEDENSFPSALAGVEILRRCRVGQYGSRNQEVPIFMRTARGEPHVKRLCIESGASGYFQVGIEDEALIER